MGSFKGGAIFICLCPSSLLRRGRTFVDDMWVEVEQQTQGLLPLTEPAKKMADVSSGISRGRSMSVPK